MIGRTFDPEPINRICNHPAVFDRTAAGHPGPLDMTPVVSDRKNIVFVGEHGAIVFAPVGGGVFEAHATVLPSGRGEWTLRAGCEAVRRMFEEYDAAAILFPCPPGNVQAKAGAQMLGARKSPLRVKGYELYCLTREMIAEPN